MIHTRDSATTDVLDRLGDLHQTIWSAAEIHAYLNDGQHLFTRRTKCLYDIWVIENAPQPSNYHTDLERSLLEQKPGRTISDLPFQRTSYDERQGVDKRVGGSYGFPSVFTQNFISSPDGSANPIDTTNNNPLRVSGGKLPNSTVDIMRVAYNLITIRGMSSAQMREIDNIYELRTGDPQWWIWDKDGLFFLRVVPAATGQANYDYYVGSWGTRTYSDDYPNQTVDTSETGGYGILRLVTGIAEGSAVGAGDNFPAGGPWGTPTRFHPEALNIKVEYSRLARTLTGSGSQIEVPDSHYKYVVYWAMQRALRRNGPGQDLKLADHYSERFELGIKRMIEKKDQMQIERRGRFGGTLDKPWLGWPQAPYPYGKPF